MSCKRFCVCRIMKLVNTLHSTLRAPRVAAAVALVRSDSLSMKAVVSYTVPRRRNKGRKVLYEYTALPAYSMVGTYVLQYVSDLGDLYYGGGGHTSRWPRGPHARLGSCIVRPLHQPAR